jgi:thiamine-monophosphate kinase
MGAAPRASLLSLALPAGLLLDDFDELVQGYAALAAASGAFLIGGNMAASPGPLVVNVTAIGSARRRRVLRRDTARAGHELYVTGVMGAAAAGLAILRAGVPREAMDAAAREAVERYEQPAARSRLGWMLGRTGAVSAAMDVSDGLAATATALATASGVGVILEADAIPVADAARVWAAASGQDPVSFALAGGEDYELAVAVPPRIRRKFLATAGRVRSQRVTRIGRFVAERGAWLSTSTGLIPLPGGFEHWRGTEPFSTKQA